MSCLASQLGGMSSGLLTAIAKELHLYARLSQVLFCLGCLTCATVGAAAAQSTQSQSTDSVLAISRFQQAATTLRADSLSGASVLQSIDLLKKAVEIAKRSRLGRIEDQALYNVSTLYRQLGSSDSALAYAGKLLVESRSRHDSLFESFALYAFSQVYAENGRADSLLMVGTEALQICQTLGPRTCFFGFPLIALMASYLPNAERDIPQLEELADSAQRHGDLAGANSLDNVIGMLFSERLQHYDSAIVHYRRVMLRGGTTRETIWGMGRAFRSTARTDSAAYYFQLLKIVARKTGDLRTEAYALGNIAELCHRSVKPPNFDCALAYYDSSASVASALLRQSGADLNRVAYGEQATEVYSEWTLAWLSTSPVLGKENAQLGAFSVAELGRSAALRDIMGAIHTRDRIPPMAHGLFSFGRELLSRLPAGSATLSYLVHSDTVLAWLTLPGGSLRGYRWAVSSDSLAAAVGEVRVAVGADEALSGARLRGIGAGHQSMTHTDSGRLAAATARLARFTMPDDLDSLVSGGTDLILVTSGVLNEVPFAILPLHNRQMLGLSYPIRYAPSLIALVQLEERRSTTVHRPGRPSAALVVSNPTMPVVELGDGLRFRLSPLPGADAEGAWVAAQLGGKYLSGAQATETAVRRDLRGADIIHFATHAFAYSALGGARNSFLALAPDSSQDGSLTVGEIMDDSTISFHAELVVLSACQTALGLVTDGEGTVGLQRAFLAKGARAVLVSQWSVDDEATTILMKAFYNHWLGDADVPTKAVALQRAQADVRATNRFSAPIYWSAFQLVGAN